MNISPKLDPAHSALFAYLFESTDSSDIADTLSFRLAGDFGGEFFAGMISLDTTDDIKTKFVFTLPRYCNDVFIALTESDYHETARYLANLEDYERQHRRQLDFGDVVIIAENIDLPVSESYGLYLLRTASSLDLRKIQDSVTLGDVMYRFFLAIVLSRYEYDFRLKNGNDALLDYFMESGKSLLMFECNGKTKQKGRS